MLPHFGLIFLPVEFNADGGLEKIRLLPGTVQIDQHVRQIVIGRLLGLGGGGNVFAGIVLCAPEHSAQEKEARTHTDQEQDDAGDDEKEHFTLFFRRRRCCALFLTVTMVFTGDLLMLPHKVNSPGHPSPLTTGCFV